MLHTDTTYLALIDPYCCCNGTMYFLSIPSPGFIDHVDDVLCVLSYVCRGGYIVYVVYVFVYVGKPVSHHSVLS